jgi:hypothetical protein
MAKPPHSLHDAYNIKGMCIQSGIQSNDGQAQDHCDGSVSTAKSDAPATHQRVGAYPIIALCGVVRFPPEAEKQSFEKWS